MYSYAWQLWYERIFAFYFLDICIWIDAKGKGYLNDLWFFVAKATYAAIANTYSYLTPDLWKETAFTKSPYQEFTDYLAKNHTRQPGQRQEQKVY